MYISVKKIISEILAKQKKRGSQNPLYIIAYFSL